MNRYDWYFRQKVMEDELDGEFNNAENADLAQITDLDFGRNALTPDEFGGAHFGWEVSTPGGLSTRFTSGAGYDEQGRRIHTATSIDVSAGKAGHTAIGAGGDGDGASTAPTEGYERWVTILVLYDRLLSDLRWDGYNNPVYFHRSESFRFNILMGVEKTIGNLLPGDKPARQSGQLLLVDVRIKTLSGATTIVSLDETRKEWLFNVTATSSPYKNIKTGRLRSALKTMLQYYNDHVGGTLDKHPATAISFTGGQVWHDGNPGLFGASDEVQEAFNSLLADLKSDTGTGGAHRLGAKALTSVAGVQASSSPSQLTLGSIQEQLQSLLNDLNKRVFRGGDDGIAGNLIPTADGFTLGTALKSFDVFARDLKVKGAVTSSLIPTSGDLGSTGSHWSSLFVDNVWIDNDCEIKDLLQVGRLSVQAFPGASFPGDIDAYGDVRIYGDPSLGSAGNLELKGLLKSTGTNHILQTDGALLIEPNTTSATGFTVTAKGMSKTSWYSMEERRYLRDGLSTKRGMSRDVMGLQTGADDLIVDYHENFVCGVTESPLMPADFSTHFHPILLASTDDWILYPFTTSAVYKPSRLGAGCAGGDGGFLEMIYGPPESLGAMDPEQFPAISLTFFSVVGFPETNSYSYVSVVFENAASPAHQFVALNAGRYSTDDRFWVAYYDSTTVYYTTILSPGPRQGHMYKLKLVLFSPTKAYVQIETDGSVSATQEVTLAGSSLMTLPVAPKVKLCQNGSQPTATSIQFRELSINNIHQY